MPDSPLPYVGIYLVVISFLAIGLTAYDKRASKSGSRRIRERALLLVSVAGGSVAMLVTMYLIRHKTRHAKFMAGIPLIILLQTTLILLVLWRLKEGTLF